jgi:hypothetical protein
MTFILQELNEGQFLSPAIQTNAITELAKYMRSYFRGSNKTADDKPTCAVCFDMSGTGKTTTIMEASTMSGSIRAPISLIDNELFRPLLDSCKDMGEKQDPPLKLQDSISYSKIEKYFGKRFQTVLAQVFDVIIEQLNRIDTEATVIEIAIPNYISPTKTDFPLEQESLSESYKNLVATIESLDRLLVIHLDDCQKFFCGLTETVKVDKQNSVKVDEIMGFALRLFSRHVSSLKKSRNILWVFSGTRPNLGLEMKVASTFWNPFDISKYLCDFDVDNIFQIIQSYFLVDGSRPLFKDKLELLCGPPKLVSFFIQSSAEFRLKSIEGLIGHWEEIERGAIIIYREQIKGTIDSFGLASDDLEHYARNLCLLHTHLFINSPEGYLNFENLPSSWLPFIEAGMIRVRPESASSSGKRISGWCVYPPNRFLVKIFNGFVHWFCWENIQDLVANIKASATTTTLKGKVFEYLFALELLATSDSKLWIQLGEKMKIQPKLNWRPSIKMMGNVTADLNHNVVYVMTDPDYSRSKTDVIFFADTKEMETVRVLCQLTTQVDDSTFKAKNSFLAMFGLVDDGLADYRLYLAPKSTVALPQDHKQQFSSNNCFWIDSSSFGSMLKFSWDLCDPTKTEQALTELMNFAASLDDSTTTRKIATFISNSNKRKRGFESMDHFYKSLDAIAGWEKEDTEIVKKVFGVQRIKLSQITTLTDAKLEKYGLIQGGLREAVLSVIENV